MSKEPIIEKQRNGNYYIGLNYSESNGILRFSHEVSIWVHKDSDDIQILAADEINSDGWFTLCPKGIENKYPGITEHVRKLIEEYER